MNQIVEKLDWVEGDSFGLQMPAHGDALQDGGAQWLTRAFRAFGVLAEDNAVAAVREAKVFEGGSTGTKMMLRVEYVRPGPELHEDLFVKFSRNFSNRIMDAARAQMEPEVRLAIMAREPGFPVDVAKAYFADFDAESATGMLITRRIPFGEDGVEPHQPKCLDYQLSDPLERYRVLLETNADLAGAHKAGRLPDHVGETFAWDKAAAMRADRIPYSAERLDNRVKRFAAFAEELPQLVPPSIRTPAFIDSFAEGAALFVAHEDAIKRFLYADTDYIALSHWNANVDNAWFWRDDHGALHCGLMDWGSVGQMHIAMALWGCLSGAEHCVWERHLDELLALFIAEYEIAGGPVLDLAELKLQLALHTVMMGLAWLMDAPPLIRSEVADLADCDSPHDPRIAASELARVQLLMMTNFLMLWQREDVTGELKRRFSP